MAQPRTVLAVTHTPDGRCEIRGELVSGVARISTKDLSTLLDAALPRKSGVVTRNLFPKHLQNHWEDEDFEIIKEDRGDATWYSIHPLLPCQRPKSGFVPNPAWVTDAVASSWELMSDSVQPAWLPKLDSVKAVSSKSEDKIIARVHEYGCGSYGCVFPTHDPAVVMKVTSDESEAGFASDIAGRLVSPICVYYYSVISLNRQHDGRRMYLLWRESANRVGELKKVLGDDAYDLVATQHKAAQRAWLSLMGMEVKGEQGRPRDVQRRLLRRWVEACEAMARQTKVPQIRRLGDGMVEVWHQQRVFFGDVHDGNLGIVHRSDGGHWVITDPGYASVIRS